MANLIITDHCTNDCPFCFVTPGKKHDLEYEEIESLLPFLSSFNRPSLNILGGEPTSHPQFIEILQLLGASGWQVQIFSNGFLSRRLVHDLKMRLHDRFRFCINRSRPQLPDELISLYRSLGYLVQLSTTLYHSDQSLMYLFDEINKFHLCQEYRLGLALPVWPERNNVCIPLQQYRPTADRLFPAVLKGMSMGIYPSFDCGFPLCFFSPDQRECFKEYKVDFVSKCGIIPDITPARHVIPCFPLYRFSHKIEHLDWPSVEHGLKNQLTLWPRAYLFKDCVECAELASGACCGGCSAWRLVPCSDFSLGKIGAGSN